MIDELLGYTRERRAYVTPFEREIFGQGLETLRTGGVRAQFPMVHAALEQSKLGTSRTLQDTEQVLARTGLAGTPFGQRILGQVRLGGAQ